MFSLFSASSLKKKKKDIRGLKSFTLALSYVRPPGGQIQNCSQKEQPGPNDGQVMQLLVLFTPTQGHKENTGFHHIYNSLVEVKASTHESVCDSGWGPKKYFNAILLLEKYWGSLISTEGNYYLLQDISPNQVPGTDTLAKAPVKPSLKALTFSRLPVQLCHWTANVFHFDVGLPLDPAGGNNVHKGHSVCKGLTSRSIQANLLY